MTGPDFTDNRPSTYDDETPDIDPYQPGDGARFDPAPATDPGQYEPVARDDYDDDAYSQAQRARANAHNGSDTVLTWFDCIGCQRTAAYYGPAHAAPDPATFRCDRCQ